MAYYYGEEDKDLTEGQPETSKASSVIPAPGTTNAPVANAPATATANNARTNPGNFVGVSQYLEANKPQAAGLANKVGGVITGAADTARAELSKKAADTTKQIQANTVGFNQKAIDQLKADPAKVNVAHIDPMINAAYKGPTTLGNIDSLQKAQQAAAGVDTEEGRRDLVSSLYKDRPLKQGALTFDNLLLQASPDSKNILSNARTAANIGGIESDIATQRANVEKAAQAAKATTDKTRADTLAAINQTKGGFETDLQGRVDALRNQATQEAQGALNRLRSGGGLTGQASQRDLDLLGITQEQYQRLLQSGTNAALADQAVIRDASGINANNVASADDYARYNVLRRLAGGGDFLGTDPTQSGKYDTDLLDFNYVEPAAETIIESGRLPSFGGPVNVNMESTFDPSTGAVQANSPANIFSSIGKSPASPAVASALRKLFLEK